MAYYTGCDGYVEYARLLANGARNTKRVAKVRQWSYDTSVRLLPTTTLGECADTFTPGLSSGQGAAQLMYYRFDPGDAISTTQYQFTALLSKILTTGVVDESALIRLNLRVAGATRDRITLDCYITSARLSSNVNELSVVDIQFTQNGKLVDAIDTSLASPYAE